MMRRVLLPLAAALMVAGCVERSNTDIMTAAREYIAKGETAAATIELRALLQRKPRAGEARFLLGKLTYEAGDPVGAEDQLRLALEYGYPEEEVVPLLATVLASLNRSMALLQEFGQSEFASDPAATAELKLQVATARMFDRKFDEAGQDVERALQLVPGLADALVIRARLAAIRGDVASARQQVEAVLEREPKNATAWALKGDLLMTARPQQTDQAIQAHRHAVRERPNLVQSHAAILSMLITRGDIGPAAAQWAELSKALPRHPQTRFFEAVIALRKGDAEKARLITQPMLATSPTDLRLLLVAGEAEIRMNSLEQAEVLLSKAVKYAQSAVPPRHMLAEVYVRTGRAQSALDVLAPLLRPGAADAYAMTLAGRAHLIAGDAALAGASFAKAVKLSPEDRRIRVAAALGQLGSGQAQIAFTDLETLAKASADTAADLALISARLERKEWDRTLKAVDALAVKIPKQALPDYLRGRIMLAKAKKAEARALFEAALAKEPAFFPPVANLVALDLVEGKAAAARQRLDEIRRREPGNSEVRLALAALLGRTGGGRDDVRLMIEEAVNAKPTDAAAHLALIEHFLAAKNPDRALSVAQAATTTLPDNLQLLDALGRAYLARNDTEQAIAVFNRMSLQWPRSALPHTRLAEAHLARKSPAAAGESAALAMKESPRSLEAQRAAVVAALRQKRTAEALAIARKVQSQRPNETTGFVLEGDIEMSTRNYGAAVVAFRKALAKAQTTEAAKRFHLAVLGTGDTAEARRWADSWRSEHPDDTEFIVHLADVALTRGELEQAEMRYREVLERLPTNPLAMNNVAYAMAKQMKPGAVPLAEQAARLAPRNATVLDTLATAYAADNQVQKAVESQARAVELAPDAAVLRLNLARLYLRANEREKAIAELDRLAQLGKSFSGYSEVARLRKKVGP